MITDNQQPRVPADDCLLVMVKLLLARASIVILGFETHGNHGHNLLSHGSESREN
jgi:hypothetical protein